MIKNPLLFNFSASYSGGGFKRLYAYAKWFNQQGGAFFLIHPRCEFLIKEFSSNQFFIVKQSKIQRLLHDTAYLKDIQKAIGVPDLYYAYGIPIYFRLGKKNWFHLSNVLPLSPWSAPLSWIDRIKLTLLGSRIKKNFKHADVISVESQSSLMFIGADYLANSVVSVNGSDDELSSLQETPIEERENIAVVVGTYRYKMLEEAYVIFNQLRKRNDLLTLVIIGDEKKIPLSIRKDIGVIVTGVLPQPEVIAYLRKAKYYISTTCIENSYNAAAEGIFLAKESYISDIGPHRELLADFPFDRLDINQGKRSILHVKSELISSKYLKPWYDVVTEMLDHIS